MARITFRQKIMNAITSSLFFLLLHFNLLKICESDNVYLFWAQDVTCFFYYTIGSVINASLVLLCLQKDISLMLISKGSMLKKGIIILISYIAVFSNLFTSIILLSYCSANGLYKIIRYTKTKEKMTSPENNEKIEENENEFAEKEIFLDGITYDNYLSKLSSQNKKEYGSSLHLMGQAEAPKNPARAEIYVNIPRPVKQITRNAK